MEINFYEEYISYDFKLNNIPQNFLFQMNYFLKCGYITTRCERHGRIKVFNFKLLRTFPLQNDKRYKLHYVHSILLLL